MNTASLLDNQIKRKVVRYEYHMFEDHKWMTCHLECGHVAKVRIDYIRFRLGVLCQQCSEEAQKKI